MDDGFYIKAVLDRKSELAQSKWAVKTLQEIVTVCGSIKVIRCLALGQITEFVNPRFQAAFLLLIAERLDVKEISAYDPAFSETDKRVLAHFGIKCSESDLLGSEEVLWYVPHGPVSLISTLVQHLHHSVYIGNDLSKFDTENFDILEYKKHAKLVNIDPNSKERWFTAFNATAIHSTK